jgi:hypothetical protein
MRLFVNLMLRGAFIDICVRLQLEEQVEDIHEEKYLVDISNKCVGDERREITTLVPLLTLTTTASAVATLLNEA